MTGLGGATTTRRGAGEQAADRTALLYPTGGYHWPGMGVDIDASPCRDTLDRAEDALRPFGVESGALRRLMAGEDQARRDRVIAGWCWSGDFPLSMVAQMALSLALSRAYIAQHGPPRVLAGESMGELAAYCVAGALPLEEAAQLTYRWARDLATASDRLDLRMAVVEDLDEAAWNGTRDALQAEMVVSEASHLFVAALPSRYLNQLDCEVTARGGRTLVSNNPCAAHEPRLAQVAPVWEEHKRFLAALPFAAPQIPLVSTLLPGKPLADPESLRQNRVNTTFHRVRWGETLHALASGGVRHLIQFGPVSCGYALKKWRGEDPALADIRIRTVGTLDAIPRRHG